MAKKRENVKLIEDAVFDSVEKAQREVKFAKVNMIRTLIGTAFAVLSTVFLLIALFGGDSRYYGLALLPAIPAYLIGGGIVKALKAAWKITKTGWCLIPVFPADVLLSIAFFFLSLFVFFDLPIVFVGLNYVEHKRALKAAEAYLALYAPYTEEQQYDPYTAGQQNAPYTAGQQYAPYTAEQQYAPYTAGQQY